MRESPVALKKKNKANKLYMIYSFATHLYLKKKKKQYNQKGDWVIDLNSNSDIFR